jgi:hypothetical protein
MMEGDDVGAEAEDDSGTTSLRKLRPVPSRFDLPALDLLPQPPT